MKHAGLRVGMLRKAVVVTLFALGIATVVASGGTSPSNAPCLATNPGFFEWTSPHEGIVAGMVLGVPLNYSHSIFVDPDGGMQFLGRLLLRATGNAVESFLVRFNWPTVRAFAYQPVWSWDRYRGDGTPEEEDSDPVFESPSAPEFSQEQMLYENDPVQNWVVALWFDAGAITHDFPYHTTAQKDWSIFDYESDDYRNQVEGLQPLCSVHASLDLYLLTLDKPPPTVGENRIVCTHVDDATEEYNIEKLDPTGVAPVVAITTTDGFMDQYPSWNRPNGNRIAFLQDWVLVWTNRVGGDIRTIKNFTSASILWDVTFSPDGTRIVLGQWGSGLTFVDVSTGGLSSLTSSSYDAQPTWSPNGQEIIFARGGDLWRVVSNPGATPVQLTDTPGIDERNPNWGPGGLLFSGYDAAGDPRIFVMDPDSPATRTQLTDGSDGSVDDDDPVWSPDGAQVAYVRTTSVGGGETAAPRIWIMNADGTNRMEVPNQTGGSYMEPDWR